MKAIHGGKAKNDRIDSLKIATLLRGGLLPQAYVYPAEMRSTRDLLRRRLKLVRQRGELLAHIQNTHHQYNVPSPKVRLTSKTSREGIAGKFSDSSVSESVASDVELAGHYDLLIKNLELFLTRNVKTHDPNNFFLLRSIPGVGKILAMTILYEIHDIARFERVQNFASYARLVKCEKSSSGKRLGTGGSKIGNVHLKWAFSEAVVLFLRENPQAQRHIERLRKKHGKAKALSILAHKLGRAVYFMMKNQKPFSIEAFHMA
jgi:transposase